MARTPGGTRNSGWESLNYGHTSVTCATLNMKTARDSVTLEIHCLSSRRTDAECCRISAPNCLEP